MASRSQPGCDAQERASADAEPSAAEPIVTITLIGGNCPVQAEGDVDGHEFYFRARGNYWRMNIGGEVVCNPEWSYEEPYGDEPYAAGWMSEDEARAFIAKAVRLWAERRQPEDDGQPDEQQEWADYDPDC
jgi:hypothetical protein